MQNPEQRPAPLPPGAYVSREGWIVYDNQAYLPDEWQRRGPRRPWRRLTDEERATYKRDWMRRYRASQRAEQTVLHAVASLHSLACAGPTKATGCKCRKTVLWRAEETA